MCRPGTWMLKAPKPSVGCWWASLLVLLLAGGGGLLWHFVCVLVHGHPGTRRPKPAVVVQNEREGRRWNSRMAMLESVLGPGAGTGRLR